MSKKHRKRFKQKRPSKNKRIRLPVLLSSGKMLSDSNEEFYYVLTNRGVKKFPSSE